MENSIFRHILQASSFPFGRGFWQVLSEHQCNGGRQNSYLNLETIHHTAGVYTWLVDHLSLPHTTHMLLSLCVSPSDSGESSTNDKITHVPVKIKTERASFCYSQRGYGEKPHSWISLCLGYQEQNLDFYPEEKNTMRIKRCDRWIERLIDR